MHGFSVIGLGE